MADKLTPIVEDLIQAEARLHKKEGSRPSSSFFKAVTAVVWKDVQAEIRSRELFSAMLVFSLLMILIFNFALDLDIGTRQSVTAGVLWATFAFAGTLGLNRSMGGVDHALFALKFQDGHTHIRYPGDDHETHGFWKSIAEEKGFDVKIKVKEVIKEIPSGESGVSEVKQDRKIVFGHHRSAGDGLMFSAGIRDFKLLFPEIKINVDSNQSWIWENSPYLDTSLKKSDPDVEYYEVGYPAIASVNNTYVHFTQMSLRYGSSSRPTL